MQRALTKHTRALFLKKQILSLCAVLPGQRSGHFRRSHDLLRGSIMGFKKQKTTQSRTGFAWFFTLHAFFYVFFIITLSTTSATCSQASMHFSM